MDLLNKLEMARHELLDMGLRGNALLHIPKNKRYLDVVEERSEDIYRILVDDKASMSFLPVPDVYDEESEEQGGLTDHLSGEGGEAVSLPALKAYLDANVGSDRFGDKYLQTRLGAGELDARLLKIESEAHTLLQEQGLRRAGNVGVVRRSQRQYTEICTLGAGACRTYPRRSGKSVRVGIYIG